MLFQIAKTNSDVKFNKCCKCIERAFYNEKKDYNIPENIQVLPSWDTETMPMEEEKKIGEVNSSLDKIIDKVCNQSDGMYFYDGDQSQRKPFPFVHRFHEYFLKHRKWSAPLRDPRLRANEIFRLHKPISSTPQEQNYSAKSGDHNHFVNVVAATARLINYFSDPYKIRESFLHSNHLNSDSFKEYPGKIAYKLEDHGKRIFTLMLASFFHDIGKTVVYHRHGMEGYMILSEHTSNSWYQEP